MKTYTETRQMMIGIDAKFSSMPEEWEPRINLYRANLYGANLSRADLSGANLSRANLSGANLSGADLSRADLSGANLYEANLSRADLYGANLSGADLSRADLSGANLHEADLSGANLSGADLSRADLSRAIGIVAIHFVGFSMYIQEKMAKIGCKYMSHEDWLKIDVDTAIKMGIKREHFAAYHAFFEAAMLVLKNENPTRQS